MLSITSNSLLLNNPPSPCIETEIQSCKTSKHLTQLHAKTIKTGQIHDPIVAAEILTFCALFDHKNLEYASLVFSQMKIPNIFSWNTIIRAYSESETHSLEAISLFIQMLCNQFVKPNRYTYPSVLKACVMVSGVKEGKQVHGQIIKSGVELVSDDFVICNLLRMYTVCGFMDDAQLMFDNCDSGNVVLWNVLIDGYVRIEDFESARELFDMMPERSVVSWNAMVAGYAQNGFFKEAVEIFWEMQIRSERPNYVTLVSVLPAISRLGALELGKWVHAYVENIDIGLDDVLGSALIDMYSKCGSIDKALQVFGKLRHRNVVIWNAVIGGLALHGRGKEALAYFYRMEQSRIRPSDVSYIGVLTACTHVGLVDEGRSFFEHMVKETQD